MHTVNLFGRMQHSNAVLNLFCKAALCLIFMPSTSFPISDDPKAMLFSEKHRYLRKSVGSETGAGALSAEDARMEFKRFAGLNQTGELDNTTRTTMSVRRCGVKDKVGHPNSIRRKRYVLQGSKWSQMYLSYRIGSYPSEGIKDRQILHKEMAKAFKVWSDVTPLMFREKRRGRVNIDIRFAARNHGDGLPFDGPGNTLAHAFYPNQGGDVHFDDDEMWTINERNGTNLFQVAVHEIGHSLGLDHSDNDNAVMGAYYEEYDRSFKLHSDDIKAIQKIYGSRNRPATSESEEFTGPPPDISDAPDLCQDGTIDAVTRTEDGTTYVFKGAFYWKLLYDNIANGYPRRISQDWSGLDENLDAALTWYNGKTYFFKGEKYWRFTNKVRDPGYPKLITVEFEGIPDDIDAAFVWGGNGKTYFFKGDQYWRYDRDKDPPVSHKYPEKISKWNGIPNDIDAAFQWDNQKIYFFKGGRYYKFNDLLFEVEEADPPYPRSTATYWFHCTPISYQNVPPSSTV